MGAYVFRTAAQVVKVYGDPVEGKLKRIVKTKEPESVGETLRREGSCSTGVGEHVIVLPLDGEPPYACTRKVFSQMWEEVVEGSGVYRPRKRVKYITVPPGDQVTLTGDGCTMMVTYPDCIGLGSEGQVFKLDCLWVQNNVSSRA